MRHGSAFTSWLEAPDPFYPESACVVHRLINGFYYDVDLAGQTISSDDFQNWETNGPGLRAKSANKYGLQRDFQKEAMWVFQDKGDSTSWILLERPVKTEVLLYYSRAGNFIDLCRRRHACAYRPDLKLQSWWISPVLYWRASDEKQNKQLTRTHGITFPKKSQLDEYSLLHAGGSEKTRTTGRWVRSGEIDFTFDDDVGPGLPLWMPNGAALIEQRKKLAKTEQEAGFQRVRTPHISESESMYLASGHFMPYYAEIDESSDGNGWKYYLKAMRLSASSHQNFQKLNPSYRDFAYSVLLNIWNMLPVRTKRELFDWCVRCLQMNDAHI